MAVNERRSSIQILPFTTMPVPDGSLDSSDRAQILGLYSGLTELSAITIKIVSIDSIIKKLASTTTTSLDAILDFIHMDRFTDTDEDFWRSTASDKWKGLRHINIDSYIQSAGLTQTSTIDSFLKSLGITITAGIDSYVSEIKTITTIIDGILQSAGLTINSSIDSLLKALDVTTTANLDALLAGSLSYITANVDAIIEYVGDVCWGHDTSVTQDNIKDFSGQWSGNATVIGSDDAELLQIEPGQYMQSNPWWLGAGNAQILINQYNTGQGEDPVIQYRTASTEEVCTTASWEDFSTSFYSQGWVQIKLSR